MSDRRVAWIRAQLDATEAAAKAAEPRPWLCSPTAFPRGWVYVQSEDGAVHEVAQVRVAKNAEHIALHDPAAVLADVASKRKLLYLFTKGSGSTNPYLAAATVRLLAEGFRGRPGYEDVMRDE